MTKYLISRILRSLVSVVIVVAVIMLLIYSFLDKQSIFATDPVFTKQKNNQKMTYQMQQWERFGYLDYVPYDEFLLEQKQNGALSEEDYKTAVKLGKTAEADSDLTAQYVAEFIAKYKAEGYEVERLDGMMKGKTNRRARFVCAIFSASFSESRSFFSFSS